MKKMKCIRNLLKLKKKIMTLSFKLNSQLKKACWRNNN